MSGNVWEWCWNGEYKKEVEENPKGSESGDERVARGGSWYDFDDLSRVVNRLLYDPDSKYIDIGFRISRAV